MVELDEIPIAVKQSLQQHCGEAALPEFAVHADRTLEFGVGECFLFASSTDLIWISGQMIDEEEQSKHDFGVHKEWRENGFGRYSIRELSDFSVEEMLSGGRLTAIHHSGQEQETPVLLAYFTNFCKESVALFAKYANRLAKGESPEMDPQDDPTSKRCPKCGRRYPDINRKICPHCMEKGKLFLRFSKFFMRYRGYLFLTVLSLLLLTAMNILVPYLSSGFFYDEVIYGDGAFAGQLILVLSLILAARAVKMLTSMLNNYVTGLVSAKVVFDLKKTIFSAIERLSLGFFTGRQTGGLMTQVNEDADTIHSFFCDEVPYLLINIVQVVVLSVLLFLISPMLAFFALLTVPLFFILIRQMFQKQRKLHAKRYSDSKRMNAFLVDVLSGMRVVKAFSKEQEEIHRFNDRNCRLAQSEKNQLLFTNYARPLIYQILYFGHSVAWGLGGWMVISGHGNLTYGMLLTFISYLGMIYSPLESFVSFMDETADCTNAMQRLFEIMDAEPDVRERTDPLRPASLSGQVTFSHVSFSYQKGKKIIDDVSFEVPDGHILGVVGHTGAGKSTLANLLMRMYDVDEGEICIGGYPVRDLALDVIYRNIAIVSQETYLFIGTILDNIRYARPDADFEEVVEAAKFAGAHEFIMKLPDAYHTRIGFGYQDLSGGERQRLSIARAILKNPKILILDEATAAMDTATERKIQSALTELIRGKTTIMIAHRLSTLRDADELVVIEHGRVAEHGTHETLLEQENGIYRKLYMLQLEALKNAGISE